MILFKVKISKFELIIYYQLSTVQGGGVKILIMLIELGDFWYLLHMGNVIKLSKNFYVIDKECWDVCVAGGCSRSCLFSGICPAGFSCMGGRCFAQCDLEEQAKGEHVCGTNVVFQCRLGLSDQMYGTGLCTFVSDVPVNTDKVGNHKMVGFTLFYVSIDLVIVSK